MLPIYTFGDDTGSIIPSYLDLLRIQREESKQREEEENAERREERKKRRDREVRKRETENEQWAQCNYVQCNV